MTEVHLITLIKIKLILQQPFQWCIFFSADIEEELQNVGIEQDQDDDSEEVAAQNKKVNRDTTASKLNLPLSKSTNDVKTENASEERTDGTKLVILFSI